MNKQVWWVRNRSTREKRRKEIAGAKICGGRRGALKDIRGVEGRYLKSKESARPNGQHEIAETAFSCMAPKPTRTKNEIFQSLGGGARACTCGSRIESKTSIVKECAIYREEE